MSLLFTPKNIGNLEIKNRIVRSATYEKMASDDGEVTERLIECHRELARGGAGLIITGHAFVHPMGKVSHFMTGIHKDDMIPGLRRLADSVHKEGGKIFIQINHGGRQTSPEAIGGKTPLAPSPVPDRVSKTSPREMTDGEIQEVIEAFCLASERAKIAGFDAVQIHGAHGFLISEFISPYTNRREDRWGGSLENRMRFPLEVYKSVRRGVGENYPVLIKLNSSDFLEGGLEVKESIAIALALEKEGIDAVEISGGMRESRLGASRRDILKEDMEAYFLSNAREFRKALNIPLILVGGLRSRKVMERVLEEGTVDFVSMSRPLIREPDLPNKMKEGKEKADCISCNGCFGIKLEYTRCTQV